MDGARLPFAGADGLQTDAAAASSGAGQITLYTRRWVVLGTFSLVTLANSLVWISYSTIETALAPLWGGADAVNSLSTIFMWVYIPGVWIGLYLTDRYSTTVCL